MDIFLLTYDNGEQYEGNQNYTIAVFNDYDLAVKFILDNGFHETPTKDYFKKGEKYLIWDEETITIDKIEFNKSLVNWEEREND